MKKIETILKEELKQLKQVMEATKQRLVNAPEGALRVRTWNGKTEYYYRSNDTENAKESRSNGRYLKKKEEALAKSIAQRDYDTAVVDKAKKRIYAIEKFLKTYEKTNLKQLYQDTVPGRRQLIIADIMSDEEYAKHWQSVVYQGKEFTDDDIEIITERGERVRSKSEKIIADKLYALGIPYRYEYPICMAGGEIFHRDFTVLHIEERKEMYWEHLGMLDDMDYLENALQKIIIYEKNGIFPGKNLILTYETKKNPLNPSIVNMLIDEYLKND